MRRPDRSPLTLELRNVRDPKRLTECEAFILRQLDCLALRGTLCITSTNDSRPSSLIIDGAAVELGPIEDMKAEDLAELLRFHLSRAAWLRTVLFVCTGNAVRSQMAEALVNHFFGARWAAFSAGTMPMEVQRDVITVMKELHIDITDRHAKHVDLFRDCIFDKVVVLCSDAGRRCPEFPYAGQKDQLDFEDPLAPEALAGGVCLSYKSRLRSLRKEIKKKVSAYLEAPG
jgi:arsenate reductase